MDAIALTLRLVKGSALSHEEADGNFTKLKTACDQLNSETVKTGDAEPVTDTKASPIGADQFLLFDSADGGVPKLTTKAQVLAEVSGRLDGHDELLEGLEAYLESML